MKDKIIEYMQKRLNERSFWVGVALAVAAAAILPAPWSYISFVAGTIGSLVPEGKISA